ncbi:MAG: [citrate (pro-3S)-lyase] ligase, partial [Candidatus Thorarchaeota archaeon]
NNPTEKQRKVFSDFLEKQGLEYEENIEMSLKVVDNHTGEMVGTGSIAGKILKCIAIDQTRRGEGLSAHIISQLVKEQHSRGRNHIFVFTDPKNIEETLGNVFAGFKLIANTDDIAILEMGTPNINDYLEDLKAKVRQANKTPSGIIGSIVVNCNPFTLGHQYLIETAAKECDFLYVFVVTEDLSIFPTNVRIKLVKEGTKHISNMLVLEGGDYIISPATFPRYFMKEYNNLVYSQARLDITIFSEYIAATLGISKRYVGEEPYCLVTKSYNQAMLEILPSKNISLKIIPRKELNGKAISASEVRRLLFEDNFEAIAEIVPKTTYNFLVSEEARPIIEKIKTSHSRH